MRALTHSMLVGSVLCSLFAAAPAAAQEERREAKPRIEWVWANAEGGVEVANLRTFNANFDTLAVGLTPTHGVGPAVGIGAGVRLLFITLGVRGRMGAMQDSGGGAWQLWTADAEIGARIPLQRFEPYLTLAAGYAAIGGFAHAVEGLGNGLDVSGANVRIGAGLDVYVTKGFSIGGLATGEMLVLTRDGVALRDLGSAKEVGTIDDAKARVLASNGSSLGGAMTLSLVLGVHL